MKRTNNIKGFILTVIVSSAAIYSLPGCGSSQEMTSKYSDNKVIIDGKDNEWENKTTYLKDDNILVGMQNDDNYLYLLISTSDRQKERQILNTGLNIWFDTNGGSDKKFGIRFPMGRIESGAQYTSREDQPADQEPGRNQSNLSDKNNFSEIEIYDPGSKNWNRNGLSELKGIQAKAAVNDGVLVCEYQIPLKPQNADFYLPLKDNKIGVGIETNEIDFKNMRNKMAAGREGGGMGTGDQMPGNVGGGRRQRNGGAGGRMGRQGGGRSEAQMPKQVKQWFEVNLSQK